MCTSPPQITASLTPSSKSAIPKKTGTGGVKNSVVGVQRRNTFGYGDSAGGSGPGPRVGSATDATNKKAGATSPGSANASSDIRR